MNTSLVWFTNNLRVNDNQSLTKACAFDKVIAVYCFDPRQFDIGDYGFVKTGKYRTKFLLESIRDVQKSLTELNIALLIYLERPEKVLPKIVQEYDIKSIFHQNEWTRDENEVIDGVRQNLESNVQMIGSYEQFLFHPSTIPFDSIQQLPNVFTNFRKKCEKYSKVEPPLPIPDKKEISNLIAKEVELPTLEQLGHQDFELDSRTAFPFKGGEDAALERIQHYFWETEKLSFYKKTRNGLIGIDYSSKLSPWLANGSISSRTIYNQVKKYERQIKKNQDTYWLIFELIWRDYFKYVSLKYKDRIFYLGGILNKSYEWANNSKVLDSWINGTTQEPFVNANMLELKETGWMSNRGRQNVASYWAKELKQDWRIGAAYFESLLLDYDVHSNWGNWMYNSGVGNDPRDRKFNIKRQAEMYDKAGKFQRIWLQETLFR
ncbi:DASH family cryptochrome [Muricauda sp. DJ-13]|uniref:Cryptochrome DASH n=2 Tax=Croceivirga thetidis TaxID=2721623 RepID=A0ABX1GWS7_9FLAO|nr:DASH family cryptochrome [Croceivirga thetidis]